MRTALIILCLLALTAAGLWAQAPLRDDRIMLQGFYWESHRHGHADFPRHGTNRWYQIVEENAARMAAAHFDLVWLPPPSYAGELSAGYNPKEYFNFNNSYGTAEQQQAALNALLAHGIEPIADIVINHRDGTKGWADFQNPDWGPWAVCREDEAFLNPESGLTGVPVSERGNPEEVPAEYSQSGATTYRYPAYRDLDHSNPLVRADIITYLLKLREKGYRGWRYDMVHGFHARHIVEYNHRTQPTFSVGEYAWDKHNEHRGWIWHTAMSSGDLSSASALFDFTTFFTLANYLHEPAKLAAFGYGPGLIGDRTDGVRWQNRAVTFVENHDTGYREAADGSPATGLGQDTFSTGPKVEQAYAFILSHPGVPCVFWKHFFDWGPQLRARIAALTNARKVAGVHADSELHIQDNALKEGVYAARVQGSSGDLYVRIGGDGNAWQPSHSGYRNYREYAAGDGWQVWVSLPGNPPVLRAPLASPFPPAD